MKVMNGLDLQAQRIVNLADPSAGADAANKQYVDNVARGLAWKAPARAASTAAVTLAAPGATLDGVALAAGDRVLLKNQTAAAENGLYVWTASGAPLVRAADADQGGELTPGTAVTVTEGTANGDRVFIVVSDAAITIGATAQTWGLLGGSGSYAAGNGVTISGGTISAAAAANGGVTVGAGGIALDPNVAARKFSANIGNGSATSIAVAHNLGTKDVAVSLRRNADDAGVLTDWTATDANTVTLAFAAAPAAGEHRVTVIG